MKNYGKVIEYNGTCGKIKGIDGEDYILLDKNLLKEDIKVNDNVEFEPEIKNTPEIKEIRIARFVKVLKNRM